LLSVVRIIKPPRRQERHGKQGGERDRKKRRREEDRDPLHLNCLLVLVSSLSLVFPWRPWRLGGSTTYFATCSRTDLAACWVFLPSRLAKTTKGCSVGSTHGSA